MTALRALRVAPASRLDRAAAALGLLGALSAGACSRPALDGVPADPVAFVRHEPSGGLASLDEFRAALRLGNPAAEPETMRPRLHMSVSLLSVPSGEVRPVPGVSGSTLPLDWSPDGHALLLGRWDRSRRAFHLVSWNRLTGAIDPVVPEISVGEAALGRGPIRLALIARTAGAGGASDLGVHVFVERRGLLPLPGAAPGVTPDVAGDGRSVVFARPARLASRDGTLLLARLGEGPPVALGRGDQPRFSRDGRWITFVRRRDGQPDVWVMRANGTGKRAVTGSSYDEEYPAVSPDGRYVVYASVRPPENKSQLYLARTSDGYEVQLTRIGHNSRPIW